MWFWLSVKTSEKWWTTLWFWRGQRSLNKVSVKSFPLSNQEMDSDLGATVKVRLYCYFPKTECLILEAGTHRTVTASNLYSNTQVPALFLICWIPWVHSLTGYHPTYKVPFLLPSLSLNSLLWVGYSRTSHLSSKFCTCVNHGSADFFWQNLLFNFMLFGPMFTFTAILKLLLSWFSMLAIIVRAMD